MDQDTARLVRRHLVLGWILLPAFMLLGLTLETLHGFKVQWYLSVANETRRFLWTLGHAHGALLGLVNIALALTLRAFGGVGRSVAAASTLILCGSLLLPAGFLLGGIVVYGGDPGLFIVLSPVGGLLLVCGMALAAVHFVRRSGVEGS
jgi:hypothetical protein